MSKAYSLLLDTADLLKLDKSRVEKGKQEAQGLS